MKYRLLWIFLIALVAGPLTGLADEWSSDYAKSLEKAKAENKMVLLDFTGSGWCASCIKLEKEVFLKPAFKEYARKTLVLVKVDFPPSMEQAKKDNVELAEMLGVPKGGLIAFPTLVVMDPDGKKLGDFFYDGGGPAAFIAEVEKLRKH
jgi:thioredoxin-related protein